MRVVIVTGVSGAGKSTALRALEDLNYYCADNLPLPLLPKFVELLSTRQETERVALGIDARSGDFLADSRAILSGIREAGHTLEILFLDAPDDVLIRRFSETRRRHPLMITDIREALIAERIQLGPMRLEADAVIDTGGLTMHALRGLIQDRHRGTGKQLSVNLMSFGFKHGLPLEADIVLDVRFLPNPFFVKELAPLTGEDEPVRRFVLDQPDTQSFLVAATELLRLSLGGFEKEGKAHATIAIGCTGGQHRSVAIVSELAGRFGDIFAISARHRDVGRGGGS
ncbi:MAG: RNase adapter RapZ [Deltaproteobacteria bacterium]|nr:RNase adapter RapZ [Deltaproteobacteria bacterium]